MINLVWASVSLAAWLSGSTILQARARNQPFDLRLAFAILALTMITFHLYGSFMIASTTYSAKSLLIPFIDLILLNFAALSVKKRMRLGHRFVVSFTLILFGSLSFWVWYVDYLGGLLPR